MLGVALKIEEGKRVKKLKIKMSSCQFTEIPSDNEIRRLLETLD
jgi:hypothetical protein